jgi:hypothetical protein
MQSSGQLIEGLFKKSLEMAGERLEQGFWRR